MAESLWPNEFPDLPDSAPVQVLRVQGAELGKKTKGIVEGRVVPLAMPGVHYQTGDGQIISAGGPGRIVNTFQFFVPALEYTYDLLIVSHTAVHYPVDLYRVYEGGSQLAVPNPERCASEAEFKEALRRIFTSQQVGRLIRLLLEEAAAQK